MDLSKPLYESLTKYFNVLSKTGKIKKEFTKNLLVYSFVDDVMSCQDIVIMSEDEFRDLMNGLNIFLNTHCMYTYNDYRNIYALNEVSLDSYIRLTQDSLIRISSGEDIRMPV